MEIRCASNPKDVKHYTTDRLREEFLIEGLFQRDEVKLVYSHVDRIIVGSISPTKPTVLTAGDEIRAAYFLERRELGIINIGPKGSVTVDGIVYELDTKDGLYIGLGAKDILFDSLDAENPAKFWLNSAPAHMQYPTVMISDSMLEKTKLGTQAECNQRTISKYIHPMGVKSCQLVMGLTVLEPGSVWNTMPCHTHDRRMEVYLYFGLPSNAAVFHYMGEPEETRHIVMKNEQAAISPSWSIHSGCGTTNYTFIWGMVGENQMFTDMDAVSFDRLK